MWKFLTKRACWVIPTRILLTHAVMDSLLGAAALGDIGRHFPDSDPLYLGADSLELLRQVCHLLKKKKLPYRKY